MKFYVFRWWTDSGDPCNDCDTFEYEYAVLQYLNDFARKDNFRFRVIQGHEVEFVPAEVVLSYRRK